MKNDSDLFGPRMATTCAIDSADAFGVGIRSIKPILRRALRLGRGPESLLVWLRQRTRFSSETDCVLDDGYVHQLAVELSRSAGVRRTEDQAEWHCATVRNVVGATTTRIIISETLRDVQADSKPLAAARLCRLRETILVADDEPSVREVIRHILDREGFHVLVAKHGREAIAIANAYGRPIELLLTEVILPELDGVQLARQLAASRPELKVLFTSGSVEEVTVRLTTGRSDAAFLEKPFTPTALMRKIDEILCGLALSAFGTIVDDVDHLPEPGVTVAIKPKSNSRQRD